MDFHFYLKETGPAKTGAARPFPPALWYHWWNLPSYLELKENIPKLQIILCSLIFFTC